MPRFGDELSCDEGVDEKTLAVVVLACWHTEEKSESEGRNSRNPLSMPSQDSLEACGR